MIIDRKQLAQLADWEAAAVAIALPWSTSAASILLVVWLITLIPTLDAAAIWRELKSPAGCLPVLLWLIGAAGMLWADVSWAERLGGLGSFHRLLTIPLFLAQFRRSANARWALLAWIGTVVVVESIVSSLTSSHLFDFVHGWLYVLAVGIMGGMMAGPFSGSGKATIENGGTLEFGGAATAIVALVFANGYWVVTVQQR